MLKLYYGHIQMVKDPLVFEKWFKKVDSQRKEKILQCKQEEDKQRSLLAGVLFNYGLENNRNAKQVFYSISHSGDYVICVLADRRVGVDIENRFRSLFSEEKKEQRNKVARKCFTMGESIEYHSRDEEEKIEYMLDLWTKKESYSKAIGKGLGLDFSLIDTQEMDALFWSGWLEKGYYCSLYVENGEFRDMKIQEVVSL